MKVKLNTEWLSDCGGCHVAIVDLHEKILQVLEAVEIGHCPVLTDIKNYPDADVGIISGAIRNQHERDIAVRMRKACKAVIAFGTCAVYGGISGAGAIHSRDEIFDAVYRRNKTTELNVIPGDKLPPLESTVHPLDEVIDVDMYLPGCPPHPYFIFEALAALIEGRKPHEQFQSVCARCRREMRVTDVGQLRRGLDGIPDEQTCFLSQGRLCFGSVTLDRCLAACPNNGAVCTGCAGPTMRVLTEPNRDIRTEVAERMSRLTAIKYADVLANIEKFSKTHYAYAMATSMIGQKPTFLIREWIQRLEVT